MGGTDVPMNRGMGRADEALATPLPWWVEVVGALAVVGLAAALAGQASLADLAAGLLPGVGFAVLAALAAGAVLLVEARAAGGAMDPLPWLAWDSQRGAYCRACGHGIADAADPAEHDPACRR